MSYYKIVGGVKYDRSLLEQAEAAAEDGQVSFAEAKELWESAADGPGVTDIERATLQYVVKTLKFTAKAADFLKQKLAAKKTGSYYKQIDGVKYDRELLEQAEKDVADGQISVKEAQALYEKAQDGPGITETEGRTLRYILDNFKCTDKAAEYLRDQLKTKKKSYYKMVNGINYDREILEMAEKFAKDGQVSYDEAKQMWDSALDGPGVTDCEKRTLEYTLEHFKYTPKAAEYMRKKLASLGGGGPPKTPPKPQISSPMSPRVTPASPQVPKVTPASPQVPKVTPPSPSVPHVAKRKLMDADCAKQAIGLIDHTLLGDKDTEADIQKLVDAAVEEQPHTAAVCVHRKFVKFVRSLQHSNAGKYPRTLRVATVVNFPSGKDPVPKVVADTQEAVKDGADEIDLVIDYGLLKQDVAAGATKAEFLVRQVRWACPNSILKVIIESGELKTEQLINAATSAACSGNADFVKTSTGKASEHATPEAVEVMLKMIERWNKDDSRGRVIGLKVSGGLKTADQALSFMQLASKHRFGSEDAIGKLDSKYLRLGTSSLLPILRAALKDDSAKKPRLA